MGWRYLLLGFIICMLISLAEQMGGLVSGLNLTDH
jgi:hypothetical protein